MQEECDKIGPIPIGEAAITNGGNLKTKHVIHAASMVLRGPLTTSESLVNSTKNSLLRADEKELKTIAFPAIGTGVAGFPVGKCAELMINTVLEHLKGWKSSLEKVYFVLFDKSGYDAFKQYLAKAN
ncbi:MAG: macro domain-containing protein [Candidatus Brocadiales bacterium]